MSLTLPNRGLPSPGDTPVFARRAQGILSRVAPDRRRHKRIAVTLLGRFMRANRQEYPCKMIDVSVGGAGIMSPVEVDIGERIVAYFDLVGGIEGHVARNMDGGFGMKIVATVHKREKLAAQLTFLLNKAHLGDFAQRRHERMKPKNGAQSLTLTEGLTISCQVVDFSLSGAFIATPARPDIGAEIKLGNVRCKVIRHQPEGIAVQFADVQHPNALRKYFG